MLQLNFSHVWVWKNKCHHIILSLNFQDAGLDSQDLGLLVSNVQIPCTPPSKHFWGGGERLLPLSPSYRVLLRDKHGPALKSSGLSVFVQLPETCLRFERAPALVARESKLADLIFLSPRYWQVMILSCFHQHPMICE